MKRFLILLFTFLSFAKLHAFSGITSTLAYPEGQNGNVQYNDSGSFGGEYGFNYDENSNVLSVFKGTFTSVNTSTLNVIQINLTGDFNASSATFSSWMTVSGTSTFRTTVYGSSAVFTNTIIVDSMTVLTSLTSTTSIKGNTASFTGAITASDFIKTGASYSSFSLTMDGGDLSVVISTTGFDPLGIHFVTGISTLNLTAVRFYNVLTSTVGATNFRLAYTTTTNITPSTWSYITQQVAVSTNAVFSDWTSLVGNVINSGEKISLHITAVPVSGTLPTRFGAQIRYWRKNE